MALFRKKISYEKYWLGLIDSFFAEAVATQEVFIIIFPEFNSLDNNSKSLMEKSNITRGELLAFKLVCALVSIYINLRTL